MRARDRAEHQDDREEAGGRGRRVLEQLEADHAGRERSGRRCPTPRPPRRAARCPGTRRAAVATGRHGASLANVSSSLSSSSAAGTEAGLVEQHDRLAPCNHDLPAHRKHDVGLPARPVGPVDPHLVLDRVATGGLVQSTSVASPWSTSGTPGVAAADLIESRRPRRRGG